MIRKDTSILRVGGFEWGGLSVDSAFKPYFYLSRLLFSLGGAAAFQDCVIHVDGKLTFANNTGSSGGALLIMSSQIKLHPYSELTFIGNQAKGIGGAVYVLEYMMDEFIHANNPDCFLAYLNPLLPPSKWKVYLVPYLFLRNCPPTPPLSQH